MSRLPAETLEAIHGIKKLWKGYRRDAIPAFAAGLSESARRHPIVARYEVKALSGLHHPRAVLAALNRHPGLTAIHSDLQAIQRDAMREVSRIEAEEAVAAQWGPREPRHIAILGLSYCGSTLLGALMGSLPDVGNVGESFWLTHAKKPGFPPIRDFGHGVEREGVLHCVACGPGCEVFNAAFRRELAADPRLWYLRIARRLGVATLVSSDKLLGRLVVNDPLLRFQGLVLFKSPEQHWWSNLRKLGRDDARFNPTRSLDGFMNRWLREYRHLLYGFEPRGRLLFLCFDEFCAEPERHLTRLAKHLGLTPELASPRRLAGRQHTLGGNAALAPSLRPGAEVLEVKPLPPAEVPREDRDSLGRNEELQAVWRACMDRHRETFSD